MVAKWQKWQTHTNTIRHTYNHNESENNGQYRTNSNIFKQYQTLESQPKKTHIDTLRDELASPNTKFCIENRLCRLLVAEVDDLRISMFDQDHSCIVYLMLVKLWRKNPVNLCSIMQHLRPKKHLSENQAQRPGFFIMTSQDGWIYYHYDVTMHV